MRWILLNKAGCELVGSVHETMKLEGDYAVGRSEKIHRTASLVVAVFLIALVFHRAGLGQAIRFSGFCLLPLSCIWFPESMASFRDTGYRAGRGIDAPSHPVFLRWGGWFLLAGVPAFLWWIGH